MWSIRRFENQWFILTVNAIRNSSRYHIILMCVKYKYYTRYTPENIISSTLVITYINCCRVIQNEEKKSTPPWRSVVRLIHIVTKGLGYGQRRVNTFVVQTLTFDTEVIYVILYWYDIFRARVRTNSRQPGSTSVKGFYFRYFFFFHLISLLAFGVAATTRRIVFLLIIKYRLWKGRGRVEKAVRKHMRRRWQNVLL